MISKEYLAKEAERLLRDDVLAHAVEAVRAAAVDALIAADATKIHDVVRLQAKIAVCDEFMAELESAVLSQAISARPGIA